MCTRLSRDQKAEMYIEQNIRDTASERHPRPTCRVGHAPAKALVCLVGQRPLHPPALGVPPNLGIPTLGVAVRAWGVRRGSGGSAESATAKGATTEGRDRYPSKRRTRPLRCRGSPDGSPGALWKPHPRCWAPTPGRHSGTGRGNTTPEDGCGAGGFGCGRGGVC